MIILTWNGLKHLKSFLPSVVQTNYPEVEIILADNFSSDGSDEWVRTNFPDVRIVSLDDNYGYTGGNNRAAAYAENEILVFLNNDVEVAADWLQGINEVFESDPQVAVVQPKLRSFLNRNQFEYAGAAGGFLDRFGYPYCRGRIMDVVEDDNGQYDEISDITWASGAALAIRKDLFIQHGGFDEDFSFHMEEIDLCWRVLNDGYRIKYTPKSVVYHLGGGSLPMGSSRKVYFNFRNNLLMLLKNLTLPQLLTVLGPRIILDHVAAVRALFRGEWADMRAIWRAQLHFWIRVPRFLRKRKSITRSQPVLKSIILIKSFFLEGKKTYREIMEDEQIL